jgi:hypothetical protein
MVALVALVVLAAVAALTVMEQQVVALETLHRQVQVMATMVALMVD